MSRMNTRPPPDPDITVQEVARREGVHSKTVHKWIEAGVLRARKHGRRWRVSERDYRAFRDQTVYIPLLPQSA